MLSLIRYYSIIGCLLCLIPLHAQVLSEDEVVRLTLENYPSLRISDLRVEQLRAREKTAFNPSQPELVLETPTDDGLGFEFEQEFDFPSVYAKRSKWLRSQTEVMEAASGMDRNEIVRDVRLAYLDVQIANELYRYYTSQDSIWDIIVAKSTRLYDGGEISKADLLFSQKQKRWMDLQKMFANADRTNKLEVLETYTGNKSMQVEEIQQLSVKNDTAEFYFENYIEESIDAAQSEANVWKAMRLPGIIVGYVREPEFDTDHQYRFKAGITIPIWQGQYTGEILASKAEAQLLQAEKDLRIREAKLEALTWDRKQLEAELAIGQYQLITKPQIDELTDIYNRLYEGGQVDFAVTLKNIAELSTVYPQHLEMIKLYNQSVIEIDFLHAAY